MVGRNRRKTVHSTGYARVLRLLREMRTDAGLTQDALAKRLRRPRTYVTKCELGERRIDVLEWLQFCRACDSEPTEFLKKLR